MAGADATHLFQFTTVDTMKILTPPICMKMDGAGNGAKWMNVSITTAPPTMKTPENTIAASAAI